MAETNGHAPGLELAPAPAETASQAEFDALLQGLFEPQTVDIGAGKTVEIRPLWLTQADSLYSGGGLTGAALQRYLLARCVFVNGKPLGDELAGRLPITLANRLVPVVMSANGMDTTPAADGGAGGAEPDPKA